MVKFMRLFQVSLAGFLLLFALSFPAFVAEKDDWVRVNSEGPVVVEVELTNPATLLQDQEARFRFYLTTHSGDLTKLDFSELMSLDVDGSVQKQGVQWRWAQKSSHHPIFDVVIKLDSQVQEIGRLTLVVNNVGGVKERRFEWDLNTGQAAWTRNTEEYYAVVPNAADGTVSVIDGRTLEKIDTFKVGNTASHGIAVSRDGKYMYSGDMEAGIVTIIDVRTKEKVASYKVGDSAHGVDITPDGRYVFIAGEKVSVIDTRTNQVVAVISEGLGPSPSHVEFHPNGSFAYLTDPEADTVTVIAIPEFKIVNQVKVGDGPNEGRISPDGRFLYIANWEGNEIAVLDTESLKVVNQIPAGKGTHGVVVSPDGKTIWTANRLTNDVTVIDVSTYAVNTTLLAGEYTNHLAFSPEGKYVYVTNARANEVMIVDAAKGQIVKRIPVGPEPHEVDFVPAWGR